MKTKTSLIFLLLALFSVGVSNAKTITGYDTNKNFQPVQVEAGKYVPGVSLYPDEKLSALSICTGQQGCTGIGTTTAGNIGKYLQVLSVNPLTYTYGTGGGIGGGDKFITSSINGVVTTTFTFSTSSDTNLGISVSTSSGQVTFNPYWKGTLNDSRISSASYWNSIQGIASSSYLLISNSTSLAYLGLSYPALASSTFLTIANSTTIPTYLTVANSTSIPVYLLKAGGVMSGGFTMLNATSTSLTTTNLYVSGALAFPNGSITDAMLASVFGTRTYNSSTFLTIAASTSLPYLGQAYQSLASSTYQTIISFPLAYGSTTQPTAGSNLFYSAQTLAVTSTPTFTSTTITTANIGTLNLTNQLSSSSISGLGNLAAQNNNAINVTGGNITVTSVTSTNLSVSGQTILGSSTISYINFTNVTGTRINFNTAVGATGTYGFINATNVTTTGLNFNTSVGLTSTITFLNVQNVTGTLANFSTSSLTQANIGTANIGTLNVTTCVGCGSGGAFTTTTINGLTTTVYTFAQGAGITITTSSPGTITISASAGGGDVFKAGDQTFTGLNIFVNTTTLNTSTHSRIVIGSVGSADAGFAIENVQTLPGNFGYATIGTRNLASDGWSEFALGNDTNPYAGFVALAGPTNINNPNSFHIGNSLNGSMNFWTNNTINMFLSSDGKLGVGTTAPSTTLHIMGTSTFSNRVRINTSTTDTDTLVVRALTATEDLFDSYDFNNNSIFKVAQTVGLRLEPNFGLYWSNDAISTSTSPGIFTVFDQNIMNGRLFAQNSPKPNQTSTQPVDILDPFNISSITAASTYAIYSDDITRMFQFSTANAGIAYLRSGSFAAAIQVGTLNNRVQRITSTNIGGVQRNFAGIITVDGFHYMALASSTFGNFAMTIKSCTSSRNTDISLLSNWATTTWSGPPPTSTSILIGAAHTNGYLELYFASSTTVVSVYSVNTSTKTLTFSRLVTLSGANCSILGCRVNEVSIKANFAAAMFLRDFTHAGVLKTDTEDYLIAAPGNGPDVFVTKYSTYALAGGSTGSLTKLIGF